MRRRHLVYGTRKIAQGLGHALVVGRRTVRLVANRAFSIARRTYSPQTNLGLIFLIGTAEPPIEPSIAPQANDQDATGQGVKRAAVTNAHAIAIGTEVGRLRRGK